MAALDFPSNPTNGQTYENFVYDTSITAWRNQGSPSGLAGQVVALGNATGLKAIVPSSISAVSATGGTASVSTTGAVSFSSCSSVSLNDVFTSAYRTYRIVFDLSSTSATDLYFRLRNNGSDDSRSLYYNGYFYRGLDVASSGSNPNGPTTVWLLTAATTNVRFSGSMDVYNTQTTGIAANAQGNGLIRESANNIYLLNFANFFNGNDNFSGISVFSDSAVPITGQVAIYGYND